MLCETYVRDLIYHNYFVTLCSKHKCYPFEVTWLDVCLLDNLLLSKKIDMEYIIIQHIINAPILIVEFFPTVVSSPCILKFFNVHINEPPLNDSKELEEEIITNLGFKQDVNYGV